MTRPGLELFIYWRVAGAQAPALAAARALQAELQREHAGLQARLYRRADAQTATITVMETYRHPAGLAPDLQQAIAERGRVALAAFCAGARHVEAFLPADG